MPPDISDINKLIDANNASHKETYSNTISKLDQLIEVHTKLIIWVELLLKVQSDSKSINEKDHAVISDTHVLAKQIHEFITTSEGLHKKLTLLREDIITRVENNQAVKSDDITALASEFKNVNSQLQTLISNNNIIKEDIKKAKTWIIRIIFILQPIIMGIITYILKSI